MNEPQVKAYYKKRNKLVRLRMQTKKGTPAHRILTARIQNLGAITDIVTQRQYKEV